ncbi:MAG TPA: polyprenyl synthetase family protein [Micromonosporaceae bacterium]|nr:polyprenyl synthetase family protein [Micromonosporaceae bacterium]
MLDAAGTSDSALRSNPVAPDTADLIAAVERWLADFLTAEVAALVALDPALAPLAEAARAAALDGGKRLRPAFAYWGWRGVAGPAAAVAPVLPAFTALELLHAFALVHDDVMDASATRRGRPTVHRAFAADHLALRLRGSARRFGAANAILVGDLCLVWADRLIARSGLPADTVAVARGAYDEMRIEAVAGQFLDILGEASRTWSVARALRVARLKTASYTVVRPLRYGAALAPGQPATWQERVAAAYRRYGYAVGEAFQLRDDLLGAYGDPAVTGKPAGEDLTSGKPTVLLMLARQLADGRQRRELERRLARADAVRTAALIRETGAVDEVEAMIAHRLAEASRAMDEAPIDPAARAALRALAMAAARRQA